MNLKEECIEAAAAALPHDSTLDASAQVANIFAQAATNRDFAKIITSRESRVVAELKAQIRYICSLNLDAAKSRKLVYVLTRNINIGTKENKIWLTMPDISESYHALIHVLVRSNALKNIVVQHTYSNNEIEYSGIVSDIPVVKSWLLSEKNRGEYTGCFVTLYLPSGEAQTSYHHAADIRKTHQAFSKSEKTWRAHAQAMMAKSAIMDALRYIPIFDDQIASMVEHYDNSHDWDDQQTLAITEEQAANIAVLIEEVGADKVKYLKAVKAESVDKIPATKYEQAVKMLEAKRNAK